MADETIPPTEEERKAAKRAKDAAKMRRWRAARSDEQRSAIKQRENTQAKARRAANPEIMRAWDNARHERDREKRNAARRGKHKYKPYNPATDAAKKRQWCKRNRDKVNATVRRKRVRDLNFRIAVQIRVRLCDAIKGKDSERSAVRDLGCSIGEFRIHIERQFRKGMSWDNWGNGDGKWNLDHIRPLASFDLTDSDQFRNAVHFTNYQPLWWRDNIKKGGRTTLLL
jgi:hypothetical protein